jgi:hypothetical protein
MSDAKQKYVPTQWDELKRLHSERRSKVAIKPSRVTKRARKRGSSLLSIMRTVLTRDI